MPAPDETLDLISTRESCQICGGVDKATFLRWRDQGLITEAAKVPGATGAFLFRRADVEKLAADRAAKVAS